MSFRINSIVISLLFVFFCFTSCQDEINEIENPNDQEAIVPNSTLVNLMGRTAANSGAADDILDGASCFSVELPVTVVVNDITTIIETEADLEALEDMLSDVVIDEDILDFVFPITIIFNDYSEIFIENEDELQTFVNECVYNENAVIECADFVYPISFSVFNSGFNLIDTVVIQNDEALYVFLNELEEDESVLIVSLNFPITIQYANGETVDVNTNQELTDAIEAAEQFCNVIDDDCLEDEIALNLVECPWNFSNGTDTYDNYQLIFNDNGELLISEGIATSAIGGAWSLSTTDNGVLLSLSELTAFQDDLEGDWLIVSCNNAGSITITRANTVLELVQDCPQTEGCSALEINANISECVWKLETNLLDSFVPIFMHFNSDGDVLIEDVNNLESQIGTWEIVTIATDVFVNLSLQQGYESLNGQWQVVECEEGSLYLINGDNFITLEQRCEVNNQDLLNCYSLYVLSQECDDNNDGIATFVFETNSLQSSECIELYPISGSYHPTYDDAIISTNHLNIQLTTPTELTSQTIYFRVFNQETQEFAVQELELIVEACNDDVFNCFGDFEIVECNQPNNVPVYNLSANTIGLVDCQYPFTPSFHETLSDAENNINPIANTEAYGTLATEVYLRIEAESGNFQIFNVYLNTEECNYFECFQGFDAVLERCEEDNNTSATFDLTIAFSNCTSNPDYNISYHLTQSEADANISPILNPQSFTNFVASQQTVYVRVDIGNEYQVFPIQLNVIDCSTGSCTEGDIDSILTECEWNITSYNGSDNLDSYNFNFEENSGIVVIYTDTIVIDAYWSTTQTSDGVVIEFTNVSGPNIQAINGSWLVVECTTEQLVLHAINDSNNEIVLDRTCE
ncbi:hypothetical protein [Winogradskyella damuponensis]|uniref:Lipocalin-like domain-containing protein n=1 Tax=Winogradskyella damuponensis TaxID=943939 RepID=A0ABP8CKH6_9FLAO